MLGARPACELAGSGWSARECAARSLVGPADGLRSKIGFPRCRPVPVAGPGVDGTMDALYTGRGPVCGITMRRGIGTLTFALFAGAAVDSAAIAATAPGDPLVGTSTACAACSVAAADAAGASATESAAAAGALTAIFSSRAAGAAGGFTVTPAGGGATTTTGRAATAPAGALATTAPAGGREAMAGAAGGAAMIGGAERGCGTILRGSGRAGAAAAAGFAATGVVAAGVAAGAAGLAGAAAPASPACARGVPLLPLPSSWPGWPSARRRAWRCARDRSWARCLCGMAARRRACMRARASRPASKCARTFSASSSLQRTGVGLAASQAELRQYVENPARLLTSISRARSLIRTLLIRLFSKCAAKSP